MRYALIHNGDKVSGWSKCLFGEDELSLECSVLYEQYPDATNISIVNREVVCVYFELKSNE